MMLLRLLPLVLLALFVGSCTKNEFRIEGKIDGGAQRGLKAMYVAYSSNTDELVSQELAFENGAFQLHGATRYPTIVWLFSSDRRLLYAVYAEKGDKLEIKGDFNHPYLWQVKGNKPMEQYSDWVRRNEALLPSMVGGYSGPGGSPGMSMSFREPDESGRGRGTAEELNAAVAGYVKEHTGDVCSALLLLTFYDRTADEAGFNRLWGSLTLDKEDKERLLHVAMTVTSESREKASGLPMVPITLRTPADTLSTLNPARARATVVYFWKESGGSELREALRAMSRLPQDIAVADIYLDPDSSQWHSALRGDTTSRRRSFWAFAGPMDVSLQRLSLPGAPYVIVADRKGSQLYRGTDMKKAAAAARAAR